jgi:predicted MFS family arabinose efflux permease
MILIAWWRLPESFDYLVTRQPQGALGKLNILLRNMGQSEVEALPGQPGSADRKKAGYLGLLQTPGLGMTTLLLSLCFFIIMFSFYFVLNWTPKILVDAGMSTSEGISGGVLLNIGGVVGALLLGYASARFGINKLIAGYMLMTAGLMVLFSNVTQFDASMLMLTLMLWFFIFGSIIGLYALAPHLFPVQCRSSGISIAVGVGRLGGVGSPLLAGYLFDQGWAQADGFTLFAVPLLLSAVLVLALTTGALNRKSP